MSPLLKILRSGLWIEELAEVLHLLPTLKGSQVFEHLAARVELDFPVDESTTDKRHHGYPIGRGGFAGSYPSATPSFGFLLPEFGTTPC